MTELLKDLFYVYFSYEENGRGYIGVRIYTQDNPLTDGYFGSYSDETFKPTHKVILFEKLAHKEALEKEVSLHRIFKVDTNPAFANKARQTSTGFYYRAIGVNNYQYDTGKRFDFYHPNHGVVYNSTCSFMRHKYQLTTSSLLLLSKGQIKTHKGWVIFKQEIPPTAVKHYRYLWKTPYGEHIEATPLEISEVYNIPISILVEVTFLKKRRKSYKGWSVITCQLAAETLKNQDFCSEITGEIIPHEHWTPSDFILLG